MYNLIHLNCLTQYWPKNLNEKLDHYVAYLFCQTKSKITFSLTNQSQKILALDLIVLQKKEKLLTFVLQEFEVLLLDIIELDLDATEISMLRTKLLYDLIYKSCQQFVHNILGSEHEFCIKIHTQDLYLLAILKDSKVNFENLVNFLLFGSQNNTMISLHYVEFLLHNLILQISNLISYLFLSQATTRKLFSQIKQFCQSTIILPNFGSIRSLEKLQNSITLQNLKYFYIDQPKAIYNSRYELSMLTSKGIINKTITINRSSEFRYLSYIQLFIPKLLEIQDFLIPQIKSIIIILGRILTHTCINIFNNLFYLIFYTLLRKIIRPEAKSNQ